MIIPNIWKIIKFMFQTTNQFLVEVLAPFYSTSCPLLVSPGGFDPPVAETVA